jgi:NADPH2:quinone reductase
MTQTCKAIRVHAYGGPEVLSYEDVDVDTPQDGQIRLRHTAIGLNYIDVYMRTGLYPLTLPSPIGMEGAGIVEELGDNVTDLKVGDRVAYASQPPGSYAEQRLIAADRVVKIPTGIADETAATMMLQGLTAQYLLRQTYVVQAGDTILMHAAAGGVGLIVCQWARHLGATVIGTVGSAEKAELARAHGCHHTILYQQENFKDRVSELTNGQGVNVVYDSIGKDTFMNSLACLKKRGTLVTFGNSSGPVPPFEPALLGKKGSLYLTRPTLFDYINTRENLSKKATELFDMVESGKVKIEVNQRYALKDVAQAHADLEARKTTGSTVILP